MLNPTGGPLPVRIREFHFALLVSGLDVDDDTQVGAFYSHGCEDATLEDRGSLAMATFYREAASPEAALNSALADIESAVAGAQVVGVDDQLVNATDIADLVDRTPESVRQLASGARGTGDFPPPAGIVGNGIRVWRWAEIRPWLAARGLADDAETLPPQLIRQTNATLGRSTRPARRDIVVHTGSLSLGFTYAHAGCGFTSILPAPVAAEVHSDYTSRLRDDENLGVPA